MTKLKVIHVSNKLQDMTPTELAELYKVYRLACKDCPLGEGKNCNRTSFKDCEDRIKDWLKAESEED